MNSCRHGMQCALDRISKKYWFIGVLLKNILYTLTVKGNNGVNTSNAPFVAHLKVKTSNVPLVAPNCASDVSPVIL